MLKSGVRMKFVKMPNNSINPFSSQNICRILLKHNVISDIQTKEILRNENNFKKNLQKLQSKNRILPSIIKAINIIDVIVSLNLYRADNVQIKLNEEAIYQILAKEWNFIYQKIDPLKLNLNIVTTTISHSFAMNHLVLPIDINNGYLTVATSNPFNIDVMDDIARASNLKVRPIISAKSDIIKLIDEFFGFKHSIVEAEHQLNAPIVDLGNLEQHVILKSGDELSSNDQHIIRAVNHLFSYAFDQRASDIHIEPKRKSSVIRMRIDGALHKVHELSKKVHLAIISRIKNLSRLDMAEKRKPQDGRIKMDKNGVEIEIRVSAVPVAFGEKMVMRIMDPNILQNIKELGFTSKDLATYKQFINMSYGIVLVCGPTGSGKSTTLYSTLRHLSTPEVNITTVEDPIEMVYEDFNQIAVQPSVGITFSNILRNILRQDPDIIMIGEMRDLETAQNAVQAALTGHLVFSTLHTNDAPSSITRLLDLGIPAFLIQATLICVLSQRLIRVICNHCKRPFQIDAGKLRTKGVETHQEGNVTLYQGQGCQQCRGTGYFGRIGIFEVLPYTESLKKITVSDTDLETIRYNAKQNGMITLRDNAVKKLLNGETTYQEVIRVTS